MERKAGRRGGGGETDAQFALHPRRRAVRPPASVGGSDALLHEDVNEDRLQLHLRQHPSQTSETQHASQPQKALGDNSARTSLFSDSFRSTVNCAVSR